jgi:hypothetical protein
MNAKRKAKSTTKAKPKAKPKAKQPQAAPQPVRGAARKTRERRRDAKGPLGWLLPTMEGAYTHLTLRTQPGAVGPATDASAAIPANSVLQATGKTLLKAVARTSWRDLLAEVKRRRMALAAPAAVAAPIVPGAKNWLPLGPTVVMNGQTLGNQPVAGRVGRLAVAPGGQIIYAATANGGVFRSDDGATSWRSLMDGFDLEPTNYASDSLACGAIAIDPADPNRVYVGTGEGDTNQMFRVRIVGALAAYRGVGPIRSDNGGTTWVPEPSSPDLAGEAFFALAVDARNRENVVGGTTAGLYQRVASAGGTVQWLRRREGVYPSVVEASAGSTTRFYAAAWGEGVFVSDDGQNWQSAGNQFPANSGRIALGVQTNNPNLVYALVAGADGSQLGVYRLDAPGGDWKEVASAPNCLFGGQGDYDLCIAVDPADANLIYLGGDRIDEFPYSGCIQRCAVQAAGGGYQATSPASIGTYAHADVHSVTHTPADPNELWCTCDGGVFLNRDPRGTGEFSSQNQGLSCLCSNFLGQHPTDPNIIFTGLQDNGTARTTGGPIWSHVQEGDGGYCLVNWADPSRVLVYMNGGVYASTDGGLTFGDNPAWNFGWATMTQPVVTTPYAPTKPANAKIVAVGAGPRVYISPDFASTWPNSQTLTLPGNPGSVFALAFASPTRLFIGTTTGEVFRADKSGNTWSVVRLDNVAAGPLAVQGLITDIDIDWADATLASIYVAFGGAGDQRHVWWFDGTKWASRSGPSTGTGLLDVEHNALIVDPKSPNNVYVGADIGVWHTADRGLNWTPLLSGLPEAAVYDLQIHSTQRLLRAATYGRGIYEIPLV